MRRSLIGSGTGLLFGTALMIWSAGCATEEEQSFNANFNQSMPAAPKYVVEDRGEDHFKIRMHQGSPMSGPDRVTYLKQAMTMVAQDESHRRGWSNWQVDYIQERDKGWMHVLVAVVKELPPVTMTPAPGTEPPPTAPPPSEPPPPAPPGNP